MRVGETRARPAGPSPTWVRCSAGRWARGPGAPRATKPAKQQPPSPRPHAASIALPAPATPWQSQQPARSMQEITCSLPPSLARSLPPASLTRRRRRRRRLGVAETRPRLGSRGTSRRLTLPQGEARVSCWGPKCACAPTKGTPALGRPAALGEAGRALEPLWLGRRQSGPGGVVLNLLVIIALQYYHCY